MFFKTLRKLTILNSLVFFFIFIVFGSLLYGFVAHQLFDEVDESMRQKAGAFYLVNGRPRFAMNDPLSLDPRIFIMVRDTEGSIINLYPFPLEEVNRIIPYLSRTATGRLETEQAEGHKYRVLSIPYQRDDNRLLRADGTPAVITEVLAISIVDSETAMLRRLSFIILTGLLSGLIVSMIAGLYLARRALVPIEASWDKQQQFVADASHELRTPLSVIKANTELMLRHPERTIEEESGRVTNVLRETIRMNKLVATLLTLARADANRLELNREAVDLNQLMRTVGAEFEPLAEMKGITLQVVSHCPLALTADKERLHQLLVILLDNALKYTQPAGAVMLACSRQGSHILITVKDSGCGISPEDVPHIFDRFFRGDKARSRETGGAGLGLAIAQWIVEQHGGTISAKSTFGRGTAFYVELPLS